MLRRYSLQQWFNLSDPMGEDAIYDGETVRRFAGDEVGDDVIPDESTMLRSLHRVEQHQLTAAISARASRSCRSCCTGRRTVSTAIRLIGRRTTACSGSWRGNAIGGWRRTWCGRRRCLP